MASALKQVAVASKCLAIVMEKMENDPINKRKNAKDPSASSSSWRDNGYKVFQEFQEENRISYWNPALVESVNSVDYVGFVRPGTLFVAGAELHLECLRGAWARRVLKSPSGFTIKSLGDVGGIEMQEVPQTQFIPLPEVLCLIVSGLNRIGQPATLVSIIETLQEEYSGMTIPKEEILFSTLGGLMAEGKLFCMGDHYFVPTPSMLQQYHQAFLMRRPTMMWSHEEAMFHRQMISKQQEVCSRECQTGASIANGVPPYKPPSAVGKKDQASSAKLQQRDNNAVKSSNLRKSAKEQKSERVKTEKQPGFLARLFGRPQSKNREEKEIIVQKQQNSPNAEQSGSSQGLTNPPPLATFSAQFPPPEWLYDPRYFKQTSKQSAVTQHQQHLFAKIRKSAKDANGNRAVKDDWNNVWLDLDPRGGFRRDQTDSRFVSQRHVTCPENLVKSGQWSPKHDRVRSRQKPRLSKYLSSSSECVNYLGCPKPVAADPPDVHHYKEPKKHHRSKHLTKLNLHNYQMTNLEKFPVTEPFNENQLLRNEIKKKSSAPQTPMTPGSLSVPIVITTSVHREIVVPDFAAKTSTPAVSPISCKSPNRTPFREVAQNCQDSNQIQEQLLNIANENRDSAISSTSPVITEMSSSDAKYSSWSGSDGHQELQTTRDELIQPPNTLDHTYINVDHEKDTDHSYVNDNLTNIDHTYENLSKMIVVAEQQSFDSTQFENLSVDEENIFIKKNDKDKLMSSDKPVINNNNNNEDDNLQKEINSVKIRPAYISAV